MRKNAIVTGRKAGTCQLQATQRAAGEFREASLGRAGEFREASLGRAHDQRLLKGALFTRDQAIPKRNCRVFHASCKIDANRPGRRIMHTSATRCHTENTIPDLFISNLAASGADQVFGPRARHSRKRKSSAAAARRHCRAWSNPRKRKSSVGIA